MLEAGDGMDLLDCVAWLIESRDDWAESVLVSDIRMPELGGLEVLARLRGIGWTGGIILITAFGDEATHTRARELGATMVIDKPFDLDALCDAIRRVQAVMIERHTPWIRARVVPASGVAGAIERVGPLTPYLTQTIVEDALAAGQGTTVLLDVRWADPSALVRGAAPPRRGSHRSRDSRRPALRGGRPHAIRA